jgi:hypothetical protein
MGIISIDPFSDKRWDDFVRRHPGGTIFHHSAWASVLCERYETQPDYYAVENEKREITAIAPFFNIPFALKGRRMVCLPCSEYCFPLADNPADIEKLINFAVREAEEKHIAFLEIRGCAGDVKPDKLAFKEHPYYLNHVTELEETSQILRSKLSRETRYHLNRGEKSAVTVRRTDSEEDLRSFHRLTSEMRRRIHLLPWPYRFFKSIHRHLIEPGYAFLLVAEVDKQIVSGGIFFEFKDKIINKINASDARYIQLRTNYLLMWNAIEMAYRNSCRYFDFGITNPENTGLIKYKSHWNSRQSVLPYYYYPNVWAVASQPKTSLLFKTYTAINKVLPDFALKAAAEILYKRLG